MRRLKRHAARVISQENSSLLPPATAIDHGFNQVSRSDYIHNQSCNNIKLNPRLQPTPREAIPTHAAT
jgi:hypothetical protein